MSHTTHPGLDALWLTEAVRLREEQAGPLEDSEAVRQALAQGGSLPRRILTRAHWLGRREGLLDAQRTWRQGSRLALALLLVLALASGAGLAFAALGDGQRPVNVFWALASLLGLHLLTLLGWALGLLAGGEAAGALGRLWLWLSGKLARDARAAHLAPALLVLLGRRRLARWGLGALVHGLWLLGLLTALAMLLGLLATRRYGFVWETTILGSDTFIALTQALGALPALLGFPLPDAELIRASGDAALASEAARHAWAGWLVGVLLVYGVLPRALLGLFCLWRWKRGLADLDLDLDDPGYSLLRERLMPASERLGVSDAAPDWLPEPQGGQSGQEAAGAVLVAVELDDRRPWPPKLAEGVADAGILDDGQQRRRLLEQLTRYPPARLAIACDPRRSPDRGTLALLGELARCAASTRIWLLQAPPGEALDSDRLGDWHAALERLQLPHGETSPLAWLETGHD
ncbi:MULTISPECIES: DUF2868 domain-containing protein [Pseudomonas]|uniref:DUF2868 domain-containing protein n=44 Tax=Gammaproteobacteria TaxID=1236 RepID=A0A6A9K1H6_PSEAI|nr:MULTISPECIES: DUF2868 domain-containing protein [Pseudomonas]HCL2760429.1 DUF2868 domain-containing protein [Pseudomonas aeruginosa 449A]APC70489.1 putative membrane protein [Pseudomonas aeruginosa]EJB8385615.1 DUF2868 domain-containing protein [Pseudomonas aeruginosa]EKA37479.1 hypothetical protein PABE171_0367 [Pseudomonas aeruginosa ATCC 14886]EKU1369824.1 DUF2868 domain-containing protein [Pseudomonas aeruginosa]